MDLSLRDYVIVLCNQKRVWAGLSEAKESDVWKWMDNYRAKYGLWNEWGM